MRISDWSSDVCSSDLQALPCVTCAWGVADQRHIRQSRLLLVGQTRAIGIHAPAPQFQAKGNSRNAFPIGSPGKFDRQMRRPRHEQLGADRSACPFEIARTTHSRSDQKDPHRLVALLNERFKKRSEEHTSELQSLLRSSYAAFCLKKK